MNFIEALAIAEEVLDQYKVDQPKWWRRMDGTPILNDISVRMAEAFLKASPRLREEEQKDYEGMREFQLKYIEADQELRKFKALLSRAADSLDNGDLAILEEMRKAAQ